MRRVSVVRISLVFVCSEKPVKTAPHPHTKHTVSDTAINDQPLDNNSPYAYKSSPLVAGGGDAEPDRQRRELVRWYMRQGIVKECCQQMCSRRVLRTYCKTDQQATGRSP